MFCHGAVRFLNSLLAAPQQPIEKVLSEEEVIRSVESFFCWMLKCFPHGQDLKRMVLFIRF